ncbi:MAG: N-formylglutamate amidohydrolase [Candidatus Krumholzibacteriia bacterium]
MNTRGFKILPPTGGSALPLIVHIPHASRAIPAAVRRAFTATPEQINRELATITDHLTDRLFAPARDLGATLFVNRLSRLVIDPERFRNDADESMAAQGMGAVRLLTVAGDDLRPPDFPPAAREALMAEYYDPYARALDDLARQFVDRCGRCLIIDGHSYSPTVRYLAGAPSPPICLGFEPPHAPLELIDAWRAGPLRDVPWLPNAPFAGSYVPASFWAPHDPRVRSVMIEVEKSLYLDEARGFRADRRRPGWALVRKMLVEAADWLRKSHI